MEVRSNKFSLYNGEHNLMNRYCTDLNFSHIISGSFWALAQYFWTLNVDVELLDEKWISKYPWSILQHMLLYRIHLWDCSKQIYFDELTALAFINDRIVLQLNSHDIFFDKNLISEMMSIGENTHITLTVSLHINGGENVAFHQV